MNFDEEISLKSLNKILETRISTLISHTESISNKIENEEKFNFYEQENEKTKFSSKTTRKFENQQNQQSNTRKLILEEIESLPRFTERLSSFLDYTIDFSSQLQNELWNTQSYLYKTKDELFLLPSNKTTNKTNKTKIATKQHKNKEIEEEKKKMIEDRISHLCQILHVKSESLENAVDDLLQIETIKQNQNQNKYKNYDENESINSYSTINKSTNKQTKSKSSLYSNSYSKSPNKYEQFSSLESQEYQRCLSLVSGDIGSLCYIIGDIQQKIRRTQTIHNYTQSIFQSPKIQTNSTRKDDEYFNVKSPQSSKSSRSSYLQTPQTQNSTKQKRSPNQKESPPQLQFITDL